MSEFLAPQSRNEAILQNICGAENVLPDPQSRIEKLLQAILYEDETIVDFEPESRAELLLYAILTHGEYDADPQSRNETILKAILTNSEYDALPQSRIEALLIEWLDQTHYTEKTVSGDIVTINDAVDAPVIDLTAAIEPVQDLHGYDYPWAAGAGKNLFNADDTTINNFSRSGTTFTNSDTDSRTEFYCYFGLQKNGSFVVPYQKLFQASTPGKYSGSFTTSEDVDTIAIKHNGSQRDFVIYTPFTGTGTFTLSMDVIGADPTTVGGLSFKEVQIESGSTATSYAPYSNICPITGWSGVNVTRAGKNLVDDSVLAYQGTNATKIENGYSFTSKAQQYTTGFQFSKPLEGVYTVSAKVKNGTGTNFRIKIHYSDGTTSSSNMTGSSADFVLLTKVSTAGKMIDAIQYDWTNTGTFDVIELQLEAGSSVTSYIPYQGTTYSISFSSAGTVYGGTLDVTTGLLTATMATVNLGTLAWDYGNNSGGWANSVFFANVSDKAKNNRNMISSIYTVTIGNVVTGINNNTMTVSNNSFVYIRNDAYSDAPTFKTAMSGVQLVYELATPIVYHLTPVEIRTLLGVNNIWADTGDVTVTYKARRTAAALMMVAGRF